MTSILQFPVRLSANIFFSIEFLLAMETIELLISFYVFHTALYHHFIPYIESIFFKKKKSWLLQRWEFDAVGKSQRPYYNNHYYYSKHTFSTCSASVSLLSNFHTSDFILTVTYAVFPITIFFYTLRNRVLEGLSGILRAPCLRCWPLRSSQAQSNVSWALSPCSVPKKWMLSGIWIQHLAGKGCWSDDSHF